MLTNAFAGNIFTDAAERLGLDVEIRGNIALRYALNYFGGAFQKLYIFFFGTFGLAVNELLMRSIIRFPGFNPVPFFEHRHFINGAFPFFFIGCKQLGFFQRLDAVARGYARIKARLVADPPVSKGKINDELIGFLIGVIRTQATRIYKCHVAAAFILVAKKFFLFEGDRCKERSKMLKLFVGKMVSFFKVLSQVDEFVSSHLWSIIGWVTNLKNLPHSLRLVLTRSCKESLVFINLYIRKVAFCSCIYPKPNSSRDIWSKFQVINDQRWLFTIVYEKLCLAV